MSQQYIVRFLLPHSHYLDVLFNTQSEAESLVREMHSGHRISKESDHITGGRDAAGRQWAINCSDVYAVFSMPVQPQQIPPIQQPQQQSQIQTRAGGYPPYWSGGGM